MATVIQERATRRRPRRPAVDALDLRVADGEFLVLVDPSGCGRVDGRRPPAMGDVLHVRPRPAHVHLFDAAGGERLED